MSFKDYQQTAQDLYDSYQPRNTLFSHMDAMYYKSWDFPSGMPDWVMKVVSTDPADAVNTTVRTFSTVRPHFKVMPMLPNEDNRDRANQIETAIGYNFRQAGRRKPTSVEWDVLLSATLYGMVAGQLIYLPYQEKVLKAMGKDTKRLKATRRYGDFAFIFHKPGNIYPVFSEYGLESNLTVRCLSYDEFKAAWGNLADKKKESDYYTVCEYVDYKERWASVTYNDSNTVRIAGEGDILYEDENTLGFIPYAIRMYGNALSADTDRQVMPLLQSVYESGQWDMLNVFESMDASLAFKRAARPEYAGEFPPGKQPEIDNTEPSGVMNLPVGTQNFTPLPSQSVDQRLMMEKTQFRSSIVQGTLARALTTLEFPSGTAYSSVNQILQTATNSLAPWRMLAENALSDLAHLMLCWIKYYGKEYGGATLYGKYDDKTNSGMAVNISDKEIDPDILQVEVTLTPDLPIDKLQQINGAVLMKQNFRVPDSELLEDLGYNNPKDLSERRDQEDLSNAYMAAEIQRIQMAPQLEAQQMQMQQQQEMASQQMQQEQQARMQEEQAANAQQNASPANENLTGQGWNPAMGGTPPVGAARGQR